MPYTTSGEEKRNREMFDLFNPKNELTVLQGSNLPHWFQPGATYFITFRTADSIPTKVVKDWHTQRTQWLATRGINTESDTDENSIMNLLPKQEVEEYHNLFSKAFMDYLDKGWGDCELRQQDIAKIVAECLLYFDGKRYHMGDFVIMPNHVHLIACFIGNTELLKQCRSWKKNSALRINRTIGKTGRFWQEESYDHLIRSNEQFDAIRRYIAENPKNLPSGEFYHYKRH